MFKFGKKDNEVVETVEAVEVVDQEVTEVAEEKKFDGKKVAGVVIGAGAAVVAVAIGVAKMLGKGKSDDGYSEVPGTADCGDAGDAGSAEDFAEAE